MPGVVYFTSSSSATVAAMSEKLFRRKQMLIYRVIFLAAGVWRTWTVCEDFAAEGVSFERIGYLIIGILFLIAGLIPNLASAAIARTRMAYSGKIQISATDCLELRTGRLESGRKLIAYSLQLLGIERSDALVYPASYAFRE